MNSDVELGREAVKLTVVKTQLYQKFHYMHLLSEVHALLDDRQRLEEAILRVVGDHDHLVPLVEGEREEGGLGHLDNDETRRTIFTVCACFMLISGCSTTQPAAFIIITLQHTSRSKRGFMTFYAGGRMNMSR